MITIRVSEKLLGSLIIGGVSKPLVANQEAEISDEIYWAKDTQRAIRAGLITCTGHLQEKNNKEKEYIWVRNIKKVPLVLKSVPVALLEGEKHYLPKSDLKNQDIISALQKGNIEVGTDKKEKEDSEKVEVLEEIKPRKKPSIRRIGADN